MINIKCPYCGSHRLAWSNETGYLVCQNCGAVLQSLIDDNAYHIDKSAKDNKTNYFRIYHSSENSIDKKLEKSIKKGKFFEVDLTGKVHISSIIDKKLEKLKNSDKFKLSYEILKNYPILKSRTKRNQYAIALYALYRSYGYSIEKSIMLVSKELGVSKLSLKSIIRKNKNIINKYEIEVRRSFLNKK
ncbi:TFIIB-type zinc ribbon-containing protein [Caldisphaera lagunensis]|nr:TFIIB-type zinc ribbon-containing protein [Caldisphaera lagunensis]